MIKVGDVYEVANECPSWCYNQIDSETFSGIAATRARLIEPGEHLVVLYHGYRGDTYLMAVDGVIFGLSYSGVTAHLWKVE